MFSNTDSKTNWYPFAMPTIGSQHEAQQIITDFNNGKHDAVLSQSDAYQYCFDLKAIDAQHAKFQIQLLRKTKGSIEAYETLLSMSFDQGNVKSSHTISEVDDVLLTLFKGLSVEQLKDSVTNVLIPGVGQFILTNKATVIFDKDHATPLLSTYDLLLKTSGKLNIESLTVAALTLDAKKSKLSGIVITNTLCIDHKVTNTMGLRVHSLLGFGSLFNQGRLELEGTAGNPAILGIHKLLNEKNKKLDIAPQIESSYLHITFANQGLMNGEDASISVTEKLQIDSLERGHILNSGQMKIRRGEINRYVVNAPQGELIVSDQLTISVFLNQGDVEVKNLLKLKSHHNEGTIQGKVIDIEETVTNDGQISVHELSGKGQFINRCRLELREKGVIGVYDFINETTLDKKQATVKGKLITISQNNRRFVNDVHSNISCDDLYSARPTKHLYGDNRYQPIQNKGTIKTTSLTADRWGFENSGCIETTFLTIPHGLFTNFSAGEMKVLGTITILSVEVSILDRMVIEKGSFSNEGSLLVKDLLGTGEFVNVRNKGKINFTGTQHNPSLVEIKEFDGDFNQHPSSTMCSFTDTSVIWKNVHWISGPLKEYMLPLSNASWTLDNVTCSKPITIHNHGSIYLKDSELIFGHLISHGKMCIRGGKYFIQNLSTTTQYHAGLIQFKDNACELTVKTIRHQGEIYIDPEIKQTIKINTGTLNGKTIGKQLVLDIQQLVTNEGEIALLDLNGYGQFINKETLQFTGDQQNYSTIRIKEFQNGCNEKEAKPAKITGSCIYVNGLNKAFITHDNSSIVAKQLVFIKTGDLLTKNNLELNGTIHTNELHLDREEIVNLADLETFIFSVKGKKFTNGSGSFTDEKKGILHIGSSIVSNVFEFDNAGVMKIDKGSFKQRTGIICNIICNRGYWEQNGDIDIENSDLSNNQDGTIIWKGGTLSLGLGLTKNRGNLSLDGMTSSTELAIENDGDLHLISGRLYFASLINYKNLVLIKGEYAVSTFENHGLLSFLDDWCFIQGNGYFEHNPRKENFLAFGGYQGIGEIECEKQLVISMLPVIPKKISAKDEVMAHSSVRLTFDDLMRIETPLVTLKYSSYCPGFTTLKNYHFTRIKILDLAIEGPFTLNHRFTAETMALDINGKFTIGTSNTSMGTLAATNGPLTVKAWEIHAQFGKIYGKGAIQLTATKGPLICGSALGNSYNYEKNIGFAKEYCDPVQWKFAYTTVSDVNGAYIASDSSLHLEACTDLRLSYGQIFSQGSATFSANYIEAIRSIIHGRDTSSWKAERIYIGRATEALLQLGWMSDYYPNEYMWAATSDETKIHFAGNLYFDTPSLTNVASTISSLEKIYIRYNGKNIDLLQEKPASIYLASQSKKYYCHSPKIISGEVIEMTTGDFTITATMNSPVIAIQALKQFGSGTGAFFNPSRSRDTLKPRGPIVIDLMQSMADFAARGGIFKQLANGEIATDFPLGVPSTPNANQILYLNDGNAPHEIIKQTALIHQHQNPTDAFHILNPLRSLDLNAFIQMALTENSGKAHFKDAFGRKHKGSDLYKTVIGNSEKWIQKNQTKTVTNNDLNAMTGVMLLLQLQQDAAGIRENLKLVIGADEINPYQSPGDISGDEFLCYTDGEQTHTNNRIVMENDIEVISKKGIKRETQTYIDIYEDKYISIHKTKAMPQQQWISLKGSAKAVADEDIVDIATATEVYEDVIKTSKNGSIIEKTLILPTNITTMTEEDNGPLGGKDTTTTTSVTHEFLQTTVKAGKKGQFSAKNTIDLEGSQHIADELFYWGLNYKNTSVLVANYSSTSHEESGMFSDKSTSSFQETPATALAVAMANHIYNLCDTITADGVFYQGKTLVDGSKEGGKYAALVKEMRHHQQTIVSTPLSSLDAGQEGGQEIEIKPIFHVEKIIHQPKQCLIIEDNSYREIDIIPGTDNACGFIALLSHLEVAPEKARETAVKKILDALNDQQTQDMVCKLIAPEIEDGAFGGDHQLSVLPGAQQILSAANLAESNQTQAMVMFREIFGEKETQGKTAEQLVECMEPTQNASLACHRVYRELQRAVQKVIDIEMKKKAWTSNLDTVKHFLFSVVAQPGWMLTYVPEYLTNPTGVMDALAFVLGVNVKVLTEIDAKMSVIHAHETNTTWPTVELLHCECIANSGYKNHFNLLKKTNNPAGMIFTNAEIDKQATEIVGAYKEQFYTLKTWNRQWCEKTQLVPDEVLIVVAIAVTVLTKGMGASLVNGMLSTTAAAGTATAALSATATLSATQIVMANVAFSSLAAKVTTSLLKTGDPIACVKEVLSKDNLKQWAMTIASAGIADKVGAFYGINMGAGEKAFVEHFQEHTIRNTSHLAVNALAGQHINEKMVAQTAANTVFDAISARVANNRGQMQKNNPVHPVLHGIGHAIDAFGINAIYAKVIGANDPIKIARNRAFGAFAAETLGGFLVEPGETDSKSLEKAADISRIVTAALGVALGFDANDVDKGAVNALTNNFMTAAEEEERKKKKKTLIQYVYGDAEDEFDLPKATEMFARQIVPLKGEQECRASKMAFKSGSSKNPISYYSDEYDRDVYTYGETQILFDFSQAILTGAMQGVANGVMGIANTLLHPLDSVVIPISTLLYDASIISAGHMNSSNPLFTFDPHFSEIDAVIRQVVINKPQLYCDAMKRMQMRAEGLQYTGQYFADASWQEQVRMATEITTSVATSFYTPSAVIVSVKAISNLHKTGLPFNPPSFLNYNGDKAQRLVPTFSYADIKSMQGAKAFNFVITEDSRLVIGPTHYMRESPILNRLGETARRIEINHHDLAMGSPVISAGEGLFVDGLVKIFNNKSGHYLPEGSYLKKLTEQVFKKNGFPEAVGKFEILPSMGGKSPVIIIPNPMDLLPSLGIFGGALAVIAEGLKTCSQHTVQWDVQK